MTSLAPSRSCGAPVVAIAQRLVESGAPTPAGPVVAIYAQRLVESGAPAPAGTRWRRAANRDAHDRGPAGTRAGDS